MKILDINLLLIIHKWNVANIVVNAYNKSIWIYNNLYKVLIEI